MNSNPSILYILRTAKIMTSLMAIVLLTTSCQEEKTEKRTTTLYAYEVDVAAETYSAGVLRFMESSYYEGKKLISKTYYNNDQSIKGKEVYEYTTHDSLPAASTYFGGDDVLLATYKFINKDGHQVQRDGYDGGTNELLRQERYQYDKNGNKVTKIIFDSQNIKQQTFLFGHDSYGNEKQMTILDGQDQQVVSEEYEISYIDEKNRWRERWGYIGTDKFPKTFYKQTYK